MASKKPVVKNEAQQKEEIKQAVVIDYKAIGCKCGETNTKPFIQYTLEWLIIEKFEEIFICCLPENAQDMRDFVKYFLRTEYSPSVTIKVHSSENNKSTGDCLRDLDPKGLIKSDFVIMDAGCCGNLPLAELLEQHKKLKKTDKNIILTSVVRNIFTKNPAEIGEFPVYISDPNDGILLHYMAGRVFDDEIKKTSNSIDVPSKIFLERESVKIHTNLCSTNLSIYSSNVPALYSELFDCHSESDLIQAAFDNHEVLGGSVYLHIVDDLFSQRMADFGFAINQKWDQFDTDLTYKRNDRYQVLRELVNDSLIDCTRLNTQDYLANLGEDDSVDSESETESEESLMDDDEAFLCEVLDSLVRGYEEKIENENLVLEVNSSKHAYNISISDVYSTIARALLELPHKLSNDAPKTVAEYSNLLESAIQQFSHFLLNYTKSKESKAILISTMEELCLSDQIEFLNDIVLAKILYKLYEIDALEEDSILNWFRQIEEDEIRKKELRAKPGIKQLVKALEDSDDDDDDESE